MRTRSRRAALLRTACADPKGPRRSLTDPMFNLREVAKQMILLEDHLCHSYKHCEDCIRKHLLTIEAFAEEAVSLDDVGIYRVSAGLTAEMARRWLENFEDGRAPSEIGQEVRKLRKGLVPVVCDPREAVTRVASRYSALSFSCTHPKARPRE